MNAALGYNAASQIVSESRNNDAYAFNGRYNVSRSYAVNGQNQYTSAGPASFTYDANGNLVSDGSTSYLYDGESRLVSTSTGVSLRYDPLGRLWQVSGPSGTTRFLYDGDQLTAEYDANGNMLRHYVHGAGDDDPFVWYEGAGLGDRRSLMADHQGSVIAVVDASGNLIRINAYDEYGIPKSDNLGRFQYTGQAYLPELGMYHYKARVYSPTLGRFLQTDPIGYDDQVNLYAYVASDPVNGRDPSGKNSYYVSRPVTELGIDTGYDHAFIIIADKVGGPIKSYFDFGPEKGGAINTIMNNNGKLASTKLTSTDLAAWQASDKRRAGIAVSVVPASDKSVISSGNSLVKSLGTAGNPGNV